MIEAIRGAVDSQVADVLDRQIEAMQVSTGPSGHPDLASLDFALRAELDGIWRHRPEWAASVMDPNEVYLVDMDGVSCLVLAQLPDTTAGDTART